MGVVPIHLGHMCVCVERVGYSPKRQEEAINTGRRTLALFDMCHGLFYVPTETS